MKNWIIVLLIFAMPMGIYAYLDAKAQNNATSMMCGTREVPLKNTKMKIIKFSSPMCSECKQAGEELKKAMKDHQNLVIVEEINVTQNAGKEGNYTKDAIKKYKVTIVPTLVFVNKEGKLVHRQEGAMKSEEIIEVIDSNK